MLTDFEKKILSAIQNGLPMSPSPYRDLATALGIPVEQLLAVLAQWRADGRIRRVGAVVNHFRVGRGSGAMVVWHVPEDRAAQVGKLFASFSQVSHAYQRLPRKNWPYNLYTMVHASTADELDKLLETMSMQSGVTEYHVLKTVRELKKVPPTYLPSLDSQQSNSLSS